MKILFNYLTAAILFIYGISALQAKTGDKNGHTHSHDCITKAEIETIAEEQLSRLVYNQEIVKSWKFADALDVKKKQFQYSTEWLVRFKNAKIRDKAKQIMHIYINLDGKVIGVQYTSK